MNDPRTETIRITAILSAVKLVGIILVGIILIGVLSTFAVQRFKGKAISLEERVNNASSDIKVQEKRRVDLLYNLADAVKSYNKHESETLIEIAKGRGSAGNIENVSTAITAVAEAYPELKSNENYKTYMNELAMTENIIAEYRTNYTKQVRQYNQFVRTFPAPTFLNWTGYEVQNYEELDFHAPVDAPQNLLGE